MRALGNFSFGMAAVGALWLGAICVLGTGIYAFEFLTGTEFPKAAPGAWRALLMAMFCQMIAGGLAGVLIREGE